MIAVTPSHVVDPRHPGAVDEIVHLGDYWDEAGMRANKAEILKLTAEIGRLFKRAYGYLAQAKILMDEVESYYSDSRALDIAGLNSLANQMISEIFEVGSLSKTAHARHLFASAISPGGLVNHFDTLFDHLGKRYVVTGDAGTGKSTIAEKICQTAVAYGYNAEALHCALAPDRIEHLIIPELNTAVISSAKAHHYRAQDGDTVIHTARYINSATLSPYSEDMGIARQRYEEALDRAIALIRRAKLTHDIMEQYYVANMNFDAVNTRREAIMQRILAYAKEAISL